MSNISTMHTDAVGIFQAAVQAVDPEKAIYRHCRVENDNLNIGSTVYHLSDIERILIIGAGKAAAPMALALENILEDRIDDGLISVKYGHGHPLKRVRVVEAGHPLPDHKGEEAAAAMLDMARTARSPDLVIFLLSGGGSALMPLPAPGLTLADKQAATETLLACGADIHEINTLRKHLSSIKGGRLAQAAAPAQLVTLVLSDVVGDDLDVIASGPTVPDRTTFFDCMSIIRRYGIASDLPSSVVAFIDRGIRGKELETPKPNYAEDMGPQHVMVGNNFIALEAAATEARQRGYTPLILSSGFTGDTREAARFHGAIAREAAAHGHPLAPPACILSGGETTVSIKGKGKGGRNQEFALAALNEISGQAPIVLLSAGTDGTDGPTDAAGAVIDNTTSRKAKDKGLDVGQYLADNDSYTFFRQLNALLTTGPTRTNVMDIRVILIGPKKRRS